MWDDVDHLPKHHFWAPMSLVSGCFGGVGASLELAITYMFTLLKQPSDSFMILPKKINIASKQMILRR